MEKNLVMSGMETRSPKVLEMDISELQEHFETIVDDVICGKYRVAILVNGRLVADLVPVENSSRSHEFDVAKLASRLNPN